MALGYPLSGKRAIRQNVSVTWTPLGSDPLVPPSLVDGIPGWMRRSVQKWVERRVHTYEKGRMARKNLWLVREFDQMARPQYPLGEVFEDRGFEHMELLLDDDHDLYIKFLDFLVYSLSSDYGGETATEALDEILLRSGSKWRVGTRGDHAGLEERVPVGVQDAADAAMASPGHAGSLLSEAWHAAFGVSPDFEKAYAKSIKAVEAASIPVVSPNHGGATLGTVIGQMRADADWKLEMTRKHGTHTIQQVILGNMQALWTGQNDRHAGQPGYTPSTQAEAEAAVLLAVPLVHWFSSGAIARR